MKGQPPAVRERPIGDTQCLPRKHLNAVSDVVCCDPKQEFAEKIKTLFPYFIIFIDINPNF